MDFKESYLRMIRSMSGGWGAMCGALGMTRNMLENRIYERTGQGVLVETAMLMQKFAGTTHFAEAVASASGGTFVMLPELGCADNDAISSKFHELYQELGELSKTYTGATADDQIDKAERKALQANAARIHKVVQELLGLTFQVYDPKGIAGDEE